MPCSCIRHTDLPHTSRLFADFVYNFDRVRAFYPYAPFSPSSFTEAAGQINVAPAHRLRLTDALAADNQGAGVEVQNNLDRLRQPGTLVVATGQQAGLYTGPVYTIYKALTAVRLAAHLTELGMQAVPVFWLATEDHDLAEVNHVWVFDGQGRPVRLEAAASAEANQPVGSIQLTGNDAENLQTALAGLPFGDEVGRMAAEAYSAGSTFASGFKNLLSRLLAPYGLLQLDPQSSAVRRLAAPAVARAIKEAPELTAALLGRGKELERAGYHVQVHMEEKTSLFFLFESGRRTHLTRSSQGYAKNGEILSPADLLARLENSPEDFSPNALLRPVVQDYLLPTVAFIGGPAELAYLAQSEVLYRRILGRMPVLLPRAGFTILDPHAAKLLDRYQLHLADVLQAAHALEQRIADRLIPSGLQTTFEAGRNQVEGALERMESELLAFDPTLAASLAKSQKKINYQLSKIQAKTGRETFLRNERARSDAAYLANLIFPEKTLQERLYSVLPFLGRHGLGLIDRFHECIRFDCPDHQVLVA